MALHFTRNKARSFDVGGTSLVATDADGGHRVVVVASQEVLQDHGEGAVGMYR